MGLGGEGPMTVGLIPFGGNPLDRVSNLRQDEKWVAQQLAAPATRFLLVSGLNVLTHQSEGVELAWLGQGWSDGPGAPPEPILLGLREGIAHFAIDISNRTDLIALGGASSGEFQEVRGVAASLPGPEAGIAAQARALIDWHQRHRFCPVCGGPTSSRKAGASRQCDVCGANHFPRTDPVVIMVVWRDDRCLLARRRGRPAGSFSCVAGFVEQAETIEEAVRREVEEEVGLGIDDVGYRGSQPWPFPSSLMIGCLAHATGEKTTVDGLEIAEARWFERAEIRPALSGSSYEGELTLPGPLAIAHHLIREWCEQ